MFRVGKEHDIIYRKKQRMPVLYNTKESEMNKKAGLVLRIILGGYLTFLGVSLLIQMIQIRPSDLVLKGTIAVVFILVGGGYAFANIKSVYKMIKAETEEPEETEKESQTPQFKKMQHDASLYRTAPMSLQSDVTLVPQKEENPARQTEDRTAETTGPGKKDTENEKEADPVHLAIEIMKEEDRDAPETELESDYEEK